MTQPLALADPARVIAIARSWLGTPYHDQASLRGVGCDCLGLARGVWREAVGPEVSVLAGVGSYDTAHSVELARAHADLVRWRAFTAASYSV